MADKKAPRRAASSSSSSKTAGAKTTANGKKTTAGRRGRPQGKWKRIARRIGIGLVIFTLVMSIIAVVVGAIFYQRTVLPDPNADFTTNTSFVYYNDGRSKVGNFSVQNRSTVPYQSMSQSIKDAVVAAENRTFWTDKGISPSGMLRSVWTIARGGEIQGGSTITQQYIKIYYLSSDRTMTRKLRELALAVKMGKEVPKEEILRDYLNTIYFGRGAYGIQAASRSYFNTDAKDLTVAQAAVLASVLNNPSIFDPSEGTKNAERLLDRYRYVLDGMLEMGTITQAQHTEAHAKLPVFPKVPVNSRYGGPKGYLLKMVEGELLNNGFTSAQISGGGLQITTTFDQKLQDQAVKVATEYTNKIAKDAKPAKNPKDLHVALASVAVGTGEVLALYGGADYVTSNRNWATTDRPAASSFKPYAAVAGLRNGFSLRSMFKGDTFTPEGDSSPVQNDSAHQYGDVSLLKATELSINTAFVDLTTQIPNGPAQVIKAANDSGVAKGAGWDLNSRIALGIAETSALDQAVGYSTFASLGKRANTHVVKEVKDAAGKVLYKANTNTEQAIEADICKDVNFALRSVVTEGTGGRVGDLGFEVAGKTGTSGVEGGKVNASWFVAYTKQISTAVMMVAGEAGNDDLDPWRRPDQPSFFGGMYPALVWADYMKVAMEGKPNTPFDEPAWVNVNKEKESTSTPSYTPTPSSMTPSAPSSTPVESPSTEPPSSAPETTTSEPTTVAPTSVEPTTAPPTSTEPTTAAPTSAEPTTTKPTATQSAAPTGGASTGSGP